MRRSRDLPWDGCLNVRDLGGLPTSGGEETRYGAIVRADSVRRLTEAGWEEAVAYGIRCVVDLRTDRERDEDPPADLPVDVVHVQLFEEDPAFADEVDRTVGSTDDPASRIAGTYLAMLERFRPNVAAAFRAIANAPEGVVAVHCAGGKDRTGIVSAFALALAGVDAETIAADYALSEERLRPRHEGWLAQAETEEERRIIERMMATPAAAIVRVLDEVAGRYGGVADYLREAGLSVDELERLRARLRG